MNKVVFVDAYFQPVGKQVKKKVGTGETKKGLFGGDKEVKKTVTEWQQTGYSDTRIDGARLTRDIESAVSSLNQEGYEVVSITPITSGQYNFSYQTTGSGHSGDSGYGYGYGYSITEGVTILARRNA